MRYCRQPFETASIDNRGNIYSCMCNKWTSLGALGNVLESNIIEIWQNSKINQLRQTVFDQTFSFCLRDECGELWSLPDVDIINDPKNILPTEYNIAADSNCNLSCGSCRTKIQYDKEANPTAVKILDALKRAYTNFNQDVHIYCDGSGDIFASTAWKEFFLSSDLPDCFKFVFQTNGNLLTKNINILEKLKDRIDCLIVSFDAASNETYKKIRGGKFDLVKEGVRQAVKLGINVTTQYVLQRENHHEINQYVSLCKELGVTHIGLQVIDRWPHMSDQYWAYHRIQNNPDIDIDKLTQDLNKFRWDIQIGLCGGIMNLLDNNGIDVTPVEFKNGQPITFYK